MLVEVLLVWLLMLLILLLELLLLLLLLPLILLLLLLLPLILLLLLLLPLILLLLLLLLLELLPLLLPLLLILLLLELLLRRRLRHLLRRWSVQEVGQVSADAITASRRAEVKDRDVDAARCSDNRLCLEEPCHHLLVWEPRRESRQVLSPYEVSHVHRPFLESLLAKPIALLKRVHCDIPAFEWHRRW